MCIRPTDVYKSYSCVRVTDVYMNYRCVKERRMHTISPDAYNKRRRTLRSRWTMGTLRWCRRDRPSHVSQKTCRTSASAKPVCSLWFIRFTTWPPEKTFSDYNTEYTAVAWNDDRVLHGMTSCWARANAHFIVVKLGKLLLLRYIKRVWPHELKRERCPSWGIVHAYKIPT